MLKILSSDITLYLYSLQRVCGDSKFTKKVATVHADKSSDYAIPIIRL